MPELARLDHEELRVTVVEAWLTRAPKRVGKAWLVVGGGAQRRDGEIVFRLLEDIGADAVRAVESEAVRLATWLGEVRFAVGFLPPFQRALAP
jgi:hypothetical protein